MAKKFTDELRERANAAPPWATLTLPQPVVLKIADEIDRLEQGLIQAQEAAKPKGDVDIFDLVKPEHTFESLVLPPYVTMPLAALQDDLDFAQALALEKLDPRTKLLIHGPSGCGKTSIAHAIAIRNEMPLYRASMGEMLSMYIGESEKRITKLFRFIAETKCVMLLDECDSFLTHRSGSDTAGALASNRLVNCFLVELEAVKPAGLIVAATNMFNLLDVAILRRFDMQIEMARAGDGALRAIAAKTVRPGFEEIDVDRLIRDDTTPATLVQKIKDEMRGIVIRRERAKRAAAALPGEKREPGKVHIDIATNADIPKTKTARSSGQKAEGAKA